MNSAPPPRSLRIAAALLLASCTALALANLPGDDLPVGWLLAFVLPGAALGVLAPTLPRAWPRAILGVVLQGAACWLALAFGEPMSRPAALACTILPPLGFATLRHQEADQALALFLAFCVLLVGVILDGVHLPLLAAFAACACLSLRCSNHMSARAQSTSPLRPGPARAAWRAVGAASVLVLACLGTAAATERALSLLPSPSTFGRSDAATGAAGERGPRRVGLDDSFVLGSGNGVLSEMTGEQLVRVHDPAGQPVPSNLYLRSGFFATAGLDRWQTGTLQLARGGRGDRHALRPVVAGTTVRELELERYAGARNFVFVPPATCEVVGIEDALVDRSREWIRQQAARDTGPYLVRWQALQAPARGAAVARAAFGSGLLELPNGLQRAPWDELLARWGVGTEPIAAMERIAAGLAGHCRYDRIEPTGPFATAIENFLFAAGDRRGYCMHFASAAAVMLRLRGIPCRIGVGLYGGDAARENDGARIYGSQHAHAWVEVPFAGQGYVVFDPTPPDERGQRTPRELYPGTDEAEPRRAAETDWSSVLTAIGEFLLQPWVPALLLLGVLARAAWPRMQRARPGPAASPPLRSARRLLAKLLHALAAAGHPRLRGQTLERLAAALDRERRLPPEVRVSFDVYQQVRFGGRPFDGPREAAMQAGIAAAQALPRLSSS